MGKWISSINDAGKIEYPHIKQWIELPDSIPTNQLKWINYLNVRPETIKNLKKNIRIFDIGFTNDHFGFDPKSKGNKSRNK